MDKNNKQALTTNLKTISRLFLPLLLGLIVTWVFLTGMRTERITLAQGGVTGVSVDPLTPYPVVVATIPLFPSSSLIHAVVTINPATGYAYVLAHDTSAYPYPNATLIIISETEVISKSTDSDYRDALAVHPNLGYMYLLIKEGVAIISGTEIVKTILIDEEPMAFIGGAIDIEPNSGYIYAGGYKLYSACIPELQCVGGIIWILSNGGITRLDFDGPVAAIGINPTTGYVYATYHNEGLLGFRRTAVIQGIEEIAETPSFGEAIGINPHNDYVYIAEADQNHVHVLSGTQVVQTLTPGTGPRAIGVNPRTGYIYIVNAGSNSVAVLSETQVITTLTVGLGPKAIGVNPESGYVYVANAGNNTLSVISGTQVIWTLATGHTPGTVGVNPEAGYVYVVNYGDATISVIREMILAHWHYLPLIVKH